MLNAGQTQNPKPTNTAIINMSEKKQLSTLPTVIDLFAGAGGFSLAALNCGLKVLAAVELDRDACQTYRNNIIANRTPTTRLYEKDILALSATQLREDLKLKPGELDILIGGPPCQGFSTHRINDKGVNDPRNKLLLRYFDFVKALQPRLFLVENVPGLLWPRHAGYLEKFQRAAQENGYTMLPPVRLNARDYGVPQNRERVFLLGIRADIDASALRWPPAPTHFSPNSSGQAVWQNAAVAFEPPSTTDASKLLQALGPEKLAQLQFGQPVPSPAQDACAVHMRHTPALLGRFAQTPVNGSRTDIAFRLTCHKNDYPGHKDVYGRIRLAQPGPTITTGCFNPSKGCFLHPWLDHGISVRHAARLQTFPDDFIFAGGMTNQGKQVGNAVPVELGVQLLMCLKAFLASKPKQGKASARRLKQPTLANMPLNLKPHTVAPDAHTCVAERIGMAATVYYLPLPLFPPRGHGGGMSGSDGSAA